MSKILKNNFHLFQLLAKATTKSRKKLLLEFSKNDEFFDALSEICLNVCNGNFDLDNQCKKCLRKYKDVIVDISAKPKSRTKRKDLTNQSGGFLPFLIPIVAETILKLIKE